MKKEWTYNGAKNRKAWSIGNVMLWIKSNWKIVFVVTVMFILGTILHGWMYGLILTTFMNTLYWFLYRA